MKEQGGVKERVMSTATRLFHEQGYQATGINQIIEEAGVAKSSLYQHFASKEILLNEYLSTHKEEWFAELLEYTKDTAAGKEKLLKLIDFRKFRLGLYQFKGCTFSRMIYEMPNLDETSAAIIRKHKEATKGFIYAQLEVIKDSYPAAEVQELTELLFNLMEGAIIQTSMYHSAKPLDDAKAAMVRILNTF